MRSSSTSSFPSIVQARVYDPDGALEAGFLDEVVPDGEAVDRAMEIGDIRLVHKSGGKSGTFEADSK